MHKAGLLLTMLFFCSCLVLFVGCAQQSATVPKGQWLEQQDVLKTIENGELFSGHNYYYLGSITAPDSFIALDDRFQLRSRAWAQVTMTSKRMAGWLQAYSQEMYGSCSYRAGYIYAPDGTLVGYWYSQNELNSVYMPEPGVLEICQPHTVGGMVCGEERDDGLFMGRE